MIIGVTGPLCSGKDVLGKILSEKGFEAISTGDILREEMKEKGIELTRKNIQQYVREMRKKEGIGYPSNKIASRIQEGRNYIIQGLRNDEEGKELKKLGLLIAIDASERIRFERMKERKREKDSMTFEEFKEIDDMELYGSGDGFGFNIKACMEMADYVIINDGNMDEFKKRTEEVLKELGL